LAKIPGARFEGEFELTASSLSGSPDYHMRQERKSTKETYSRQGRTRLKVPWSSARVGART
jgi:hypothetical protein